MRNEPFSAVLADPINAFVFRRTGLYSRPRPASRSSHARIPAAHSEDTKTIHPGIGFMPRTSMVMRWTYLTQPFLYSYPGFETVEIEPWEEDGETWRRLKVIFPGDIATHTREQTSYFGSDGLLRRHDYAVDVLGGATGAQYVEDYHEHGGILMPIGVGSIRAALTIEKSQNPSSSRSISEIFISPPERRVRILKHSSPITYEADPYPADFKLATAVISTTEEF
jgi:hypothetical protein